MSTVQQDKNGPRAEANGFLYSRCPVAPTLTGIATQLGWLDEEASNETSLDILIQQQQGEHLPQDPAPHRERYWLRNSGNLKAIWARSEGTQSKVIALSATRSPNQLLALPSSGIRTVADLKGKRLAIVSHKNALIDAGRASSLRTYEVALASAGLTLDDVELVEVGVDKPYGDFKSSSGRDANALWTLRRVGQRELIAPIIRGQADAMSVRGSFATELGTIFGAHVVYDLTDSTDPEQVASDSSPFTLVASQALIDEKPELLNRLLVRLLKTSNWANKHQDDAIKLLADDLGLIPETVRVAFGSDVIPGLSLNLDEPNIRGLKAHKDFLLRHGFLKNDVDIEEWIDPAPLQRALETIAKEG